MQARPNPGRLGVTHDDAGNSFQGADVSFMTSTPDQPRGKTIKLDTYKLSYHHPSSS